GPGPKKPPRQSEKERSRRGDPDDSDGERQDRSDQIPLEQGGWEKTERGNDDADRKVPSALMPLIRMAANQDHTDDAGGIWDARVDSDEEQILDAPTLDQGRHPKHHCVSGAQQKEIDQRQHIGLRILQHLQEGSVSLPCDVLDVMPYGILDQRLFPFREPGGLVGFVLQQKVNQKA